MINRIKTTNQLRLLFKSIFSKTNYIAIFFLVIAVLACFMIYKLGFAVWNSSDNQQAWTTAIDPFITIMTFLIAALIGVKNIREDWEHSIEKRLTIVFLFSPSIMPELNIEQIDLKIKSLEEELKKAYNTSIETFDRQETMLKEKEKLKSEISKSKFDKFLLASKLELMKIYPVAICLEAFLINENDIRAFAQQVGAQMSGERNLEILPYFHTGRPIIGEKKYYNSFLSKNDRKWVKNYIIGIYLKQIPVKWIEMGVIQVWDGNYEDTPNNQTYSLNIKESSLEIIDNYYELCKFIEENKINE